VEGAGFAFAVDFGLVVAASGALADCASVTAEKASSAANATIGGIKACRILKPSVNPRFRESKRR
jgi:hypothetical protein